MANFPSTAEIEYADITPSGRISAVEAQMPAMDGLEAIGQGLANLGQAFEKQANAKRAVDFSTKKRQFEETTNAALNLHQTTGDPKERQKQREQWVEFADAFTSDDPDVAAEITKWKNGKMPDIGQTFANQELAFVARETKAAHEVNLQHLMETDEIDEAENQIRNYQATTNQISPAEAEQQIKELPNQSALVQALSLLGNGLPKQAAAKISNLKDLTGNQLKEQQRISGLINKQMEVSDSESNKQLTDLMLKGQLTIPAIESRRELLSDTNYQSWAKIGLNPPDKKGNRIKAAELKSRAMDVWRGTISRDDAEKEIRESLADPLGINTEELGSIWAFLDRDVKGFQAQAIMSFSNEATRLILGKDAGVMQFDAQGNMTFNMAALISPEAEFERKMSFVSSYNKEMSDFLAENPKVSKKDLYIKAQELKDTYLAASKAKSQGKGAQFIPKETNPTEDELRRQNTIAAYEQGKALHYWD